MDQGVGTQVLGLGVFVLLKAHETHLTLGSNGCHVPPLVTLPLALAVQVWRWWRCWF